jgi:hypothetical protein
MSNTDNLGPAPEQPAPEEPVPTGTSESDSDETVSMSSPKTADPREMVKEVAKIVKSFYNRDNPEVGPFRGGEGIVIDVEKQIAEKFGEEAGSQAAQMAEAFMEKLTTEWQDRHGKTAGVADDGLARLKELVGNIKQKVEGIGDQGTSGTDFNTNIMPAEEGAGQTAVKKVKREYNQAAKDAGGNWDGAGKKIDDMKKGIRAKDVKSNEDFDRIMSLANYRK